ncbi:hypothetical protein [Massilia soli]|uniref:Uncharacterized protein n=1 Tax=Massilia soli TaxID=2792854 RepID=A0ABS7SK20_9BURK|nr:hypothetical protein [Massilia soli]MBZ2206545.1 hypothetical protein [Massilia soli]
MDTDQWLKVAPIITTIALGASTLWLAIKQYFDGNKNALREEYKFAKIFFQDLEDNPGMHAFARKKGFQAIGKNQDMPPSVIEYLMAFADPVQALSDYEASRGYLTSVEGRGKRQLQFASSFLFATEKRRKVLSVAYLLCASAFYFLAFTPWFLLTVGKISTTIAINSTIVFFPLGITVTVITTREFIQLRRAMRLVDVQNRRAVEEDSASVQ